MIPTPILHLEVLRRQSRLAIAFPDPIREEPFHEGRPITAVRVITAAAAAVIVSSIHRQGLTGIWKIIPRVKELRPPSLLSSLDVSVPRKQASAMGYSGLSYSGNGPGPGSDGVIKKGQHKCPTGA